MSRTSEFAVPRHPVGMGKTALAAVMIGLAGLATGCASLEQDTTVTGSVPDDYRTRHPIIVRESENAQDIVVAANARKLSYRDRAVAESFASQFKRSGARSMAIMIPSGSRNEAAARRIAHGVANAIIARGVGSDQIQIQHYAASGHGEAATIRLVFTDIVAEVDSRCGTWNEELTHHARNRNYYNFGCATQNNLAAMVANPADLLGPRGESEIDATRRTTVIEDWRENGSEDLPSLF